MSESVRDEATGKQERVYTNEEFILIAPAYVSVRIIAFDPPRNLNMDCSGCRKETTWTVAADSYPLIGHLLGETQTPDRQLKSLAYRCMLCGEKKLTLVYREMSFGAVSLSGGKGQLPDRLMKIGQYPAPSIKLSKSLEDALGKDGSTYYKRALISRNSGFGIAAVGYMRRVVEDKTNELIEVAIEYAESFQTDPALVSSMREALDPNKYTFYEKKLEYAAAVFPEGLRVNGVNPLQRLFRDVSKALHGLSEEKCIELADEIKDVFEYVFENLKAQANSRKEFAEKFRRLS